MKFFYPLALALAAVVAAQDSDCDAAPIVEVCLESENAKVKACDPLDYDCQCAAYQAVATCYNNCPKDPRASPAQNQVGIYCQQASLYGSAAQRKTQTVAATGSATNAVASNSASATAATRTATGEAASTSSSSTATSTPNMGVGQLARNTGGVLLAVAGVVAAVL